MVKAKPMDCILGGRQMLSSGLNKTAVKTSRPRQDRKGILILNNFNSSSLGSEIKIKSKVNLQRKFLQPAFTQKWELQVGNLWLKAIGQSWWDVIREMLKWKIVCGPSRTKLNKPASNFCLGSNLNIRIGVAKEKCRLGKKYSGQIYQHQVIR